MPETYSSYHTIFLISIDPNMRYRIAACAEEQATQANPPRPIGDPEVWAANHRWQWASSPGWNLKVQQAMADGNTDWAKDPKVISDGDVLATVQPMILAEPT